MKGGLGLLTLVLALLALKAALMLLLAATSVTLLCCFIARPREALLLTLTIGLLAIASAHPVPFAITLGLVVVAAMLRN